VAREFSQDVRNENEFFAQQWAERNTPKAAKRVDKAFILVQMEGTTTIDDNDPRWADLFSSTTSSSSGSRHRTTRLVHRIFVSYST
jgi:hypothetical protein